MEFEGEELRMFLVYKKEAFGVGAGEMEMCRL